MRKPTYINYVITILTTAFSVIIISVAFISLSSVSLKQYDKNCSPASSTPANACSKSENEAITLAILILGIVSVVVNTMYIITFSVKLMGGCAQMNHWKSTEHCCTI